MAASPPAGPALNPRFVGAPSAIAVPGADYRTFTPIPVVVIGHWSDGRAAYCTPEGATACEEAFVVDGVAWVNGQLLDAVAEGQAAVANLGGPMPMRTAEVAAGLVRAELPPDSGWTITAMAPVTGDRLDEIDPRTAVLTDLDRERITWVVHLIRFGEGPVTPETRTVLVVDGEASLRQLPAWPQRINAYPPTSVSSDPKIPPTSCVGLERAECGSVVSGMLEVPVAPGTRYTVARAHPAWVRWTGAATALEALRIVAVERSDPESGVIRRGFLLAPDRPAIPLPDGALPPWIEWAPVLLD